MCDFFCAQHTNRSVYLLNKYILRIIIKYEKKSNKSNGYRGHRICVNRKLWSNHAK